MIYGVAKNYHAHAKEMGGTAPKEPMWFLKPVSSIVHDGATVLLPDGEIHHEVELALRIGKDLQFDAYTVAIDVTNRTLQAKAKAEGKPWTQAKGHMTFCPLGEWLPWDGKAKQLELRVNDHIRQAASTELMVHDPTALLAHLRTWTHLQPGDIILTGTPEGVGPMHDGDTLDATAGDATIHVQCSGLGKIAQR